MASVIDQAESSLTAGSEQGESSCTVSFTATRQTDGSKIVSLAWNGLTDIGHSECQNQVIAQDWTSRQFIFRNIENNRASRQFVIRISSRSWENVSGYLRNPCSLSRERDTALNALGTPTADRV